MLAATKLKMSGSEKKKNIVKRNTNISSIKRVNRKLKEVSRFSRAKQGKRNVKKSVLHVQSCFLLIRSIVVVFTVLVAFNLSLVLLDFILSLRNL